MHVDKDIFLKEIRKRLMYIFECSANGYKVADKERHRMEGFMPAATFLHLVSNSELERLMNDVHFAVFGQTIAERKLKHMEKNGQSEIDYDTLDIPTFLRRD